MAEPRKLPVFKGFTVDYRLREFRKMLPDKCTHFVPFNSPEGRRLLNEYEDQEFQQGAGAMLPEGEP